jgi:hypothetical protein
MVTWGNWTSHSPPGPLCDRRIDDTPIRKHEQQPKLGEIDMDDLDLAVDAEAEQPAVRSDGPAGVH